MGARISVSSPLEERVRSFANRTEVALLLLAPDLQTVLFVNNAYRDLFGTPLETSSIADWPRLAHGDDARAVEAALAGVGRGQLPQVLRFRVQHEGRIRHVAATVVGVPRPGGRGEDIGAIVHDVTWEHALTAELEHRERMLKLIAEHADGIFWLADPDGSFRYLSPAFERIIGGATAAAWEAGLHPDDRVRVSQMRSEAIRAGVAWRAKYRIRDPQGNERMLDARGFPVHATDGRITSYVGVADDITELHAAERSLRDLQEFRTQLVNNVAHDLRNPLTIIGLQLDLLRDDDPEHAHVFERLQRNVDQINALVNDLTAAALLQAGKLTLHHKEVDLSRLALEAGEGAEGLAAKAGVELRVTPTTEPLRIKADEVRIMQVLQNFIGNALKFTPPGGKVHVSVCRTSQGARVEVRDTGAGFEPARGGELFRAFSQIHEDRQTKRGSGLGLYIAQGIVQAHGGEIGAVSAGPGRGASFWFALPLLDDGSRA